MAVANARVTEIEIEFAATDATTPKARVTEIEIEYLASAPPEPISRLTRSRDRVQRYGFRNPRQRFEWPFRT